MAVAGACLVTALISWFLAASLARPVRELTKHTESIGRGELDGTIPESTLQRGDEIGDLGRSFSSMTIRIRELLATHEQLLRDVSHELRSPLARLKMVVALVRQSADDLPDQLTRIDREVQRMEDTVGQILALTRLSSAAGVLEQERVDIAELVNRIVADACFEVESTSRSIRWTPSTQGVFVLANPVWLSAAIENVVRNALRYGAPGQPVVIQLDTSTNAVLLRVRDYGNGVPENELSRIFTPFYRTAAAREQSNQGEGLGLAITYRVMQLHGGSARAQNASGNHGLIVELTLPTLMDS
jgi:two-component system sensor histidine kinase CpxA